ncbi:MAG: DUF6691 family protein [Bdellovibrionota bacterium]
MNRKFMIFLSGVLFSVGLFISEMTNPQRVLGFLDVTGQWDPTLLFVMVGAIVPTFVLYRGAFGRGKPLFAGEFDLPSKRDLDHRLIWGSIIFGVGWGISGVCPGPGVANILAGTSEFLVFVAAMVVGMMIGERT